MAYGHTTLKLTNGTRHTLDANRQGAEKTNGSSLQLHYVECDASRLVRTGLRMDLIFK
jgi:hypothetical protein